MSEWYFAYGSNLSVRQMVQRIGSTGDADQPPRPVRLPDHRLIFQEVESGGPAFANVVRPGQDVLGVIYRLSDADFERLDSFETGYVRQRFRVIDMHGETIEAIAYVVESLPGLREGRPSDDYLARIVDGARHHGLPEPYVRSILAIAEAHAESDFRKG